MKTTMIASSSDDSDSVSLEWAKTVLLQAFAWYYIYDLISGYSSTAYVKSGNIPFMTSALTNLFIWGQAADRDRERQTHEDLLDSVLRSWNFERITVHGDGDCLFTSVAMNIKHLCQLGTESLCNILKHLSIDPNTQSIPEIVSILRKAVVNEWLGENTGDYQSFLTSDQLQEQAQAFLNS